MIIDTFFVTVLMIHFVLAVSSWLNSNFSFPIQGLYTSSFLINLALFGYNLHSFSGYLYIILFCMPIFGFFIALMFKEFIFIPPTFNRSFLIKIGLLNLLINLSYYQFNHFSYTYFLQAIVYILVIYSECSSFSLRDFKFNQLTFLTQIHFLLLFFAFLIPLFGLFFVFYQLDLFIQLLRFSICFIVFFHFFIKELQPDSIVKLKESFQEAYQNSTLDQIDIDGLDKQLAQLMKEQELFLNQDLNLNTLSSLLNISKHQLSEFINSHKQLNFNSFVNTYRIQYAKELLTKHPEYTTLAIAYMSGFNSYSTFNHSFKKFESCSPNEYRNLFFGNELK